MTGSTRRPPALAGLHPALSFALLATNVVTSFSLEHPALLALSLAGAAACLLSVRGREALRTLAALALLAVLVALVNPLVNTRGVTVLFTWASGRRYTLEALAYGAATGCSLAAVLAWFAAFTVVMTSEKLMYLFGRFAPALSTACVLVLRLVPRYGRKLARLAQARAGVGLAADPHRPAAAAKCGAATLGALATWALEDGVDTADSLAARGWGSGRRTSYLRFRWTVRDSAYAVLAALSLACCLGAAADGGAAADYLPRVVLAGAGPRLLAACASYALFVSLPALCAGEEALRWRRSRSSR